MEIGISVFRNIDYREHIRCLKKVGVNRTFVMSDIPNFGEVMNAFKENGIICETLHAPFDSINDIWRKDDRGEAALSKLTDCADKCAEYNIPAMIVHISSGKPMPEITEAGNKRFKYLMDYAKERNVTVAYENQRFLENLRHNLESYPEAKFCWDCGHEYCFTPGMRFIPLFGERLGALHIHDNSCRQDSDDHLIPFDGDIDFDIVAKDLAKSGYNGTVMLEININAVYNGKRIYEALTTEEYYKKAAAAARKLADMVNKNR